jgi:uncharacterized protein YqjF (DUF2071 family)
MTTTAKAQPRVIEVPAATQNLNERTIDRLTPETRPSSPVIGWQRWHSALFVHWELPADSLRRHVPKRLSVDTFEGKAYLSAVLFTVTGARLRPLPRIPGLSSFHEVNVRTYVHLEGKDPGVYFFSLDATNPVACALGRLALNLKYYPARAHREQIGDTHQYTSKRMVLTGRPADISASWHAQGSVLEAPHGSLEHFLTQRFFMYSPSAAGRLWREQVHHQPWELAAVDDLHVEQTLDDAQGLPLLAKRPLAHYSPGVEVEMFPPRLV